MLRFNFFPLARVFWILCCLSAVILAVLSQLSKAMIFRVTHELSRGQACGWVSPVNKLAVLKNLPVLFWLLQQ